jgi:hypothetical protein
MIRNGSVTGALLLVPALVFMTAGCVATGQGRFSVEEHETIRRTLEFPAGGTKVLEVENILGSIRVTGYEGSNIEVVANRTIQAESQDRAETAKTEVTLDITPRTGGVNIVVDGPGYRRSDDRTYSRFRGYRVFYDFEIRVPRQSEVRLSNVAEGDIQVENVTGDFTVENINGGIEMKGISGSGRVRTINGPVTVVFTANPPKDSHFGSLNGDIDVTFPQDLSADLRFKSFNGGVYTDFPVGALPEPVNQPERRNGKFVYRSTFSGARIGNGGSMLEFDGFNGDVRIRRAK